MPSPYTEMNGTEFQNNVVNALASIELTRKDRLLTTSIICTLDDVLMTRAEMENGIEYIEELVGTSVQRKLYPAEMFNIADEKGDTVDDGYIDIDYTQRDRRSLEGEDLNSLNLEVLAPVTYRVKIANQATLDLVGAAGRTPRLEVSLYKQELSRDAKGKQTESQKVMLTNVRKPVQVTSLTKEFIYEGSGRSIQSLRFFTDKITFIQIEKAGTPVQKFSLATLQHLQRRARLTPQADMVTILGETMRARYTDGDTLNNLVLKVTLTLSAIEDHEAVIEEMGPLRA